MTHCFLSFIALLISFQGWGQELFVSTEAASNIPSRSVNIKMTGHFSPKNRIYDRGAQRYNGKIQLGVSRKLMLQFGGTLSNMYTAGVQSESYFGYAKYRFLSVDELHRHFRMAAFVSGSKSNAPFHYNESNLFGEKSGFEAGVISTQLWNRFALSGTFSHLQVLDASRFNDAVYIPKRSFSFINYSLASGYLVLPKQYSSYKQVNVNIYVEVLGQQALNQSKYFIDLAPAVQAIFFSNMKLNIGYRIQVSGNMERMTRNSWTIGVERSFLNVIK